MEVATAEEKIPAMAKPMKVIIAKKIARRKRQKHAIVVRLQAQHVSSNVMRPDWLLAEFRKMACL